MKYRTYNQQIQKITIRKSINKRKYFRNNRLKSSKI